MLIHSLYTEVCILNQNEIEFCRHICYNILLFWQTIKGLSNKHVKNYNSCIDSDTWHTYFKGLFNRETGDVVDGASIFDNLTREVNADELNIPISREAIRHSILALHVNRATGTDGLCIEMYKCTLDAVLPYLHVLFNRVFDIGQFPEQWSESIISPIHKKGSKFEPNN